MTEGESGGVSKLGWHRNLIPEFDKKFVIFRNEKKKEKKDELLNINFYLILVPRLFRASW